MQNATVNRRGAEALSLNVLTERVIGACIEIHRHEAQLLTYLKLSKLTLGLLIDFNIPVLKTGIRRIVNNFQDLSASPRLRGEFDL